MKKTEKNNVIFRASWFKTLERWSPEMVKELINILHAYSKNEDVKITNERILDFWDNAKPLLDSDKNKYSKKVEVARENGKSGGAPIGNNNASKSTENNQEQPKTTKNNRKQPIQQKNNRKQTIEKEIEKYNYNNISTNTGGKSHKLPHKEKDIREMMEREGCDWDDAIEILDELQIILEKYGI
jgi:hypothetical protein